MPEGTQTVVVEAPALENATSGTGGNTTVEAPKVSLDEALKKLAEYEADASKNKELLSKLRRYEAENKAKAEKEAIEAGKYKELYDSATKKLNDIETKFRNQAVDAALMGALATAKAKSTSTVLKLVDRAAVTVNEDGSVDPKSVEAVIQGLMKSDPILFETESTDTEVRKVEVPKLHKAGEGNSKGGYNVEVRAAKTPAQIEAVMRKYGMMQ